MKVDTLETLRDAIRRRSSVAIAEQAQRYFKTGPGEYAEGDQFIGIRVPELRKLCKEFRVILLEDIFLLLSSPIHEERLLSLLLLIDRYKKSETDTRESIYQHYLENTAYINNWDLVDSSAPQIVGEHLRERSRRPLLQLAKSKSLWERRISMIATLNFIRNNDFDDALKIAELLLGDQHDLIHKASGWMLREIGERELAAELSFLDRFAKKMPRTMLRYAIEKLPKEMRLNYLNSTK